MGHVHFIVASSQSFTVEQRFTVEGIDGVSLMRLATSRAIPGIVAECGGSLSCATCHVVVADAWREATGSATRAESSMLDFVDDRQPGSRLSCQLRYRDALDGLVVHVPEPA